MNKRTCFSALLIGGMMAAAPWAFAQPAAAPAQQSASAEVVDGEVVSADPETHRVRIKHGEIKSLNMAPMTAMPYTIKDEAMFAKLKPGAKIRFTTAKIDGVYVMLTVEEVK
ncbi:MAG: copper-binding protein [Burkholderiaceae bacterium]|jgi:Cu/Ag efflux protein CusF|nr:copper-binding protein [Burkholderiaceae bacterium]